MTTSTLEDLVDAFKSLDARLAAMEGAAKKPAAERQLPTAGHRSGDKVYEEVIAKMDDGGSVGRGGECDISVGDAAIALMFSKAEINRLNATIYSLRGRENRLVNAMSDVAARMKHIARIASDATRNAS